MNINIRNLNEEAHRRAKMAAIVRGETLEQFAAIAIKLRTEDVLTTYNASQKKA